MGRSKTPNKFLPENLGDISLDTQSKMNQVFDWFNSNVDRLESAYKDIGMKFDIISQELEEKNGEVTNE